MTFRNLDRFNKGEMKALNFSGAKHGAVIWLTEDEIEAFAKHWNLDLQTFKFDIPSQVMNTRTIPKV